MTANLLESSHTTIIDATASNDGEEEVVSKIVTEVIGRVLNVKAEVTCKVMYKGADEKYHVIEAKINPYAASTFARAASGVEYNFAVPQDATEVKIIVAGDLSGDGEISQTDVDDLQMSILSGATLTEEQTIASDTNGDGKLTALDVLLIQAAQAGKKPLDW